MPNLPYVAGSFANSRYERTPQLITADGARQFVMPRRAVPSDVQPDDIRHVWADGEWLDVLAQRYYNDASLWWVIADFNQIQDVRAIAVGEVLRLPSMSRLLLDIIA